MKNLGVAIIAKNEEADIRNCLESVKEADEIVVLDTGSTDNTVAICMEYTKKIYTDYKWNDDFSEARNECLKRCTADYVIIIDCDEVLVTPIKQIKKLINEFWFRKYFGCIFTVEMSLEVFESPRLFKNVSEIFYINPAHNVPTWRGDADELVRRLYRSSFIIDSGYSQAHHQDPDRTMRILQKELDKNPQNTRAIYYMGREYMNRKMIREAAELFEGYRDMKLYEPDRWDNELADVLFLLALCYVDREAWGDVRWYDAVQCALWSWSVLPTSTDVADFLMKCFAEMPGSVDEAVRRQDLTMKFWERVKGESTNQGVLMVRKL